MLTSQLFRRAAQEGMLCGNVLAGVWGGGIKIAAIPSAVDTARSLVPSCISRLMLSVYKSNKS